MNNGGLDDVTSHLDFWRKVHFYLTVIGGLALGVWAVLSPDGAVQAAAAFFLIAMAFVTASHRSLSRRVNDVEARVRQIERKTDLGDRRL